MMTRVSCLLYMCVCIFIYLSSILQELSACTFLMAWIFPSSCSHVFHCTACTGTKVCGEGRNSFGTIHVHSWEAKDPWGGSVGAMSTLRQVEDAAEVHGCFCFHRTWHGMLTNYLTEEVGRLPSSILGCSFLRWLCHHGVKNDRVTVR